MQTRSRHDSLKRIEGALERFSDLRVLVVGDLMLDEYRAGEVERLSPEAPVPIVRVSASSTTLGGAANVARALVSLGAECRLVGVVGDDPEGRSLVSHARELGISTSGICVSPERATTHKLRVLARAQQMLRLDREEDTPIGPEREVEIRRAISDRIDRCHAVILEDYDKGLFGEGLARWVIEAARTLGIPVFADPKVELTRFRGASLLKPNLAEATNFVPGHAEDFAARRVLLEKIRHETACGGVVLTRGRFGMSGIDEQGRSFDVPTRALEVYDVQGAGDTSIAALGLCRAAGASLIDACIVANAAAAVVVEKVGTAAVDRSELRRRLPEVLDAYLAGTAIEDEAGDTTHFVEEDEA